MSICEVKLCAVGGQLTVRLHENYGIILTIILIYCIMKSDIDKTEDQRDWEDTEIKEVSL